VLFKEIIAVYIVNHMKRKYKMKEDLLIVEAGETHSNHWALNG
jgi:hypothetical protein